MLRNSVALLLLFDHFRSEVTEKKKHCHILIQDVSTVDRIVLTFLTNHPSSVSQLPVG